MTDAPLELDRLLAEAAWLRRLALHLVGDAAEADDVVQETWVAALRAPRAARLVSPRAWLAEIARRVTAGRRRGDTRRRDRERMRGDAAGPSACGAPEAAPDDVSARLELQRVVGEELDRLPEPYRSALFLQYYEGLSPQAIAARTGEPAGTVRWRTKRGRELLREALVARDGRAWEVWALALAPLAGVAPEVGAALTVAAAPAAIAVMSKWISLSAVAGVLAALGLRVSLQAFSSPPASTEARAVAPPPQDAARAATMVTRALDAAPDIEGARAAVDVAYAGPVLGRGRLRSNGTSQPEEGELSLVAADGRVVEAFVTNSAWAAPDLAPGPWRLEATAKGHKATALEVDIPASAVWTRDVELARTGVLPVRIEALDGGELPRPLLDPDGRGAMLTVYASESPIPDVVPRGTETWFTSPAGRWTPRDTWTATMPHLDPRYQGELALSAPSPLHVALVLGRHVVARRSTREGDAALVFRVDEALFVATSGSVEVTAIDDVTGAPAPCAMEFALVDGYGEAHGLRRSGSAHLVSELVPAGDYVVSLGGAYAPVTARVTVRPGQRTVLPEVRLRATTQWFDVRVEGLPVEVGARRNATLEVRASMPGLAAPFAPAWVEGSLRDARSFQLPSSPTGEVEVRLRLPGGRRLVFPPQRVEPGRAMELDFGAGQPEGESR